MLYCTIAPCFSLGFSSLSIGPGSDTSGLEEKSVLNVNYGLFKGMKSLDKDVGAVYYHLTGFYFLTFHTLYLLKKLQCLFSSLTVFCPAGEGLCLLSCGQNAEEQKKEYEYLRFGAANFTCKPIIK